MEDELSDLHLSFMQVHENQLKLQKEMLLLQQEHAEKKWDKHVEGLKAIYCNSWSSASTYSNVIILAGYAGFFGLISTVKDYVPPIGLVLSSFFMGVSLAIFVFYEVIKMVHSNRFFNYAMKKTSEKGTYFINELEESGNRFSIIHNRIWLYTFVPTVACGILGYVVALYFFITTVYSMSLAS